jgi:hypothetical protein
MNSKQAYDYFLEKSNLFLVAAIADKSLLFRFVIAFKALKIHCYLIWVSRRYYHWVEILSFQWHFRILSDWSLRYVNICSFIFPLLFDSRHFVSASVSKNLKIIIIYRHDKCLTDRHEQFVCTNNYLEKVVSEINVINFHRWRLKYRVTQQGM